ncbi:hypothetical protein Tco_0251408 [Tanacetum coccineum]
MTTLQFANTHNLVAFMSKPTESEGFEQIVDCLNANPIRDALMINPTIYTSCIEQFWATIKVKTVNREVQLQALVDGKKIIVTEASVRRDLQLNDKKCTDCLPNATIFEELTRIGAKTTTWNEFSSTMASVIICLATNQKFNFSKYIFESMMKNLDNVAQQEQSKGSAMPTNLQHIPTIIQPSTSQPQLKQRSKRPKRKDTEVVVPDAKTPWGTQLLELAKEITSLKLRVKKLEKKGGSRTHKLIRLYKVGRSARVISSDEASLGDQEDASKQGRKIDDIDKDAKITLVYETQGMYGDEEMFDTGVLDGDEVLAKLEVTVKDVNLSVYEVTLAQALAALKTINTRPKAKGLVIHEEEQATTPTVSFQQPSQVKAQDKGKRIMVEEPVKMKKKDQINLDEELAFKLQAKE